MKTVLKHIMLIAILFSIDSGYAQGTYPNHRKYWWYKSRLNNDFLKVGTGDGESIPFMQRGVEADNFSSSNFKVKMLSGDAAAMLGYYIATLATEYALLEKNQQSTEKVKHELFCALNAVNRLDYKAEPAYSSSASPMLNGFFIRDDIPKDFLKNNYQHFNYYSNWKGQLDTFGPNTLPNTILNDRGFHSKFNYGMSLVESSWQSFVEDEDGETNDETTFESQDQAYNILFGLAFVNKYVPMGETDNGAAFAYGNGQASLKQEARNIARRIIDHIRDPEDLNGNDCNVGGSQLINGWRVKNPVNCNLVGAGDDARAYGYALGESECAITSNAYSAPATANLLGFPVACPGSGYHNGYSLGPGFSVWATSATIPLYNPNHPENGMDTRTFYTNLAAVCNCAYGSVPDQYIQQVITLLSQSPATNWLGTVIGWIWKLIQILVTTFLPGFYQNITPSAITTNAYHYEAPSDHGPIAHALLHNKVAYVPNPQYSFDYLLDVAPCDGIYNFGINDQSHYQWSSDSRLDHPNRRGQDAGASDWQSPKGEYNGIDYMLYHNLYYLFRSGGPVGITANMADLSDIYINEPINLGCTNVNAYETITTEFTNITCSNPTAWRAGKTIYFGAGTSITGNGSSTTGPNFHAYIQKFDCANDEGVFRMANADSTQTDIQNLINSDSYANGAKYHIVNYPEQENTSPEDNQRETENLIIELLEDGISEKPEAAHPEYTSEFFVKPTVTTDEVRIYFKMSNEEIASVVLADVIGTKVYENSQVRPGDTGLTIDLRSLASGTYILHYTTTNGMSRVQKVIKQ